MQIMQLRISCNRKLRDLRRTFLQQKIWFTAPNRSRRLSRINLKLKLDFFYVSISQLLMQKSAQTFFHSKLNFASFQLPLAFFVSMIASSTNESLTIQLSDYRLKPFIFRFDDFLSPNDGFNWLNTARSQHIKTPWASNGSSRKPVRLCGYSKQHQNDHRKQSSV